MNAEETGLYYLQSRYYNPTIGRFINADGEILGVAGNLPSNNMFVYSINNPANLGYQSNGYSIKTLATIPPALGSATGNSTTTLNPVISNAPSFSVINYVSKVHITTPTAMLDLGFWFGRIGFSSTFTTQDKELGLFHCYSDLGNDANKYGVGINLGGWLGVGAGVSDELHLFVNAQVSPWLHGEISAGLDGIGASIGVDVGDMSYDFEIKCGAGVLIMIVAPQLFGSYLPEYNLAPR